MSRQWRSDDTDKWKYGFGSGKDGSTYAVPANAGCSGTSGGTSLTLDAASSFANGDLVIIHQTRGTGAGNWELNKIASGGGTTSITLAHNLQNTYTDSGDSQAQIIELKEYENLTVSTTVTAPAWDGNKGGIIAFLDKGTTTISGTMTLTGRGFIGGAGVSMSSSNHGRRGEGTVAAGGSQSTTASGNAAGGSQQFTGSAGGASGGGGGGNANAGSTGGQADPANGTPGAGGNSAGNTELTNIVLGGGGGSGGTRGGTGTDSAAGGNGGGIAFIFSQNLIISGSIVSGGTQAASVSAGTGGSGGGAGGSILLKCKTATLGSNLVTAPAGAGRSVGGGAGDGGAGSVGRIHIDYSGSISGSTNPTIDSRQDTTIKQLGAGNLLLAF